MMAHVVVAGTFDTLHVGHRALLSKACESGVRVTVGITSDAFVSSYKFASVSPFAVRTTAVEAWISSAYPGKEVTICAIDDPYEPAVHGDYDAIVVSTETKPRAEEINDRRAALGHSPLAIIEVPTVSVAEGIPVSSTRVREGIIDTCGRLVLPLSLRDELVRPIGTILLNAEAQEASFAGNREKVIITVGDVTTMKVRAWGIIPSLAIVDLTVQRKPFTTLEAYGFDSSVRVLRVQSGPGYISQTALEAIADWETDFNAGRKNPYAIVVHGEEDLLVLPALAHAPVGAVVYYGQPPNIGPSAQGKQGEGLVEVLVSSELKAHIQTVLDMFTMDTGGTYRG
jgi:pantetheine-phosphate adenylyltransferase